MTLEHINKFRKNHPIYIVSIVGPVFVFATLGALMAVLYRIGFGADHATAIIGENKAPKTLEFVGGVSFVILLMRAVVKGPAGIPSGPIRQWLVSGLPGVVVSIAASFFGITLGSSLGLLCWDAGVVSCTAMPAFSGLGNSAVMLVLSYLMALTLTIDKATAPLYSERIFIIGYRLLCLLILALMIGRSFILFCIIGSAP